MRLYGKPPRHTRVPRFFFAPTLSVLGIQRKSIFPAFQSSDHSFCTRKYGF